MAIEQKNVLEGCGTCIVSGGVIVAQFANDLSFTRTGPGTFEVRGPRPVLQAESLAIGNTVFDAVGLVLPSIVASIMPITASDTFQAVTAGVAGVADFSFSLVLWRFRG